MHISVPSTLRVENNTIRLVATADLDLRGTYDRPLLLGRGDIVRGTFTFEGKRYVITRGTIDFNNPTRIDPFFDIETETQVRDPVAKETHRVMVRATGTMAHFTPTFTSDPPLSQVQVLSLLFSDVAPGRDVEMNQYGAVTPQEQLMTDRAARALTGALTTQIGRVAQDTFGLDTFQLLDAGTGDAKRQLVRARPCCPAHDRQADLRSRVPHVLPQSLIHDERSDHPARVRPDRSLLLDPLPQRRPDLRAGYAREACVFDARCAHSDVRSAKQVANLLLLTCSP